MELKKLTLATGLFLSIGASWSQSRHDLMSSDPEYLKIKARVERGQVFTSLLHQFTDSVRDQGDVGTCTIFAYLGLYEAAHYRSTKQRVDFSEMWLASKVAQNRAKYSDKQIGMDVKSLQSFNSYVKNYGLCLEQSYPYDYADDLAELEKKEETQIAGRISKPEWMLIWQTKKRRAILTELRLRELHELQQCQDESKYYRKTMANFDSYYKSYPQLDFFQELINHQIPVAITIAYGKPLLRHEIIVTGHNKLGELQIKNSWGHAGNMLFPNKLSLSAQQKDKYSLGSMLIDITEAEYLISPTDKHKICQHAKELKHLKFLCEPKKPVSKSQQKYMRLLQMRIP